MKVNSDLVEQKDREMRKHKTGTLLFCVYVYVVDISIQYIQEAECFSWLNGLKQQHIRTPAPSLNPSHTLF